MRRRTALLGVACPTFGALMAGFRMNEKPAQTPTSSGEHEPVRVMAVSAKSRKRIADARVFVVGEDGALLVEAQTGNDGIATLPSLPEGTTGKYVFVERTWHFIVGRDWMPGQLEYYMPMMGLTPPGFLG
jgi:hypothetical protein